MCSTWEGRSGVDKIDMYPLRRTPAMCNIHKEHGELRSSVLLAQKLIASNVFCEFLMMTAGLPLRSLQVRSFSRTIRDSLSLLRKNAFAGRAVEIICARHPSLPYHLLLQSQVRSGFCRQVRGRTFFRLWGKVVPINTRRPD